MEETVTSVDDIIGDPQLSVADALPVAIGDVSEVQSIVVSGGQIITGLSESSTLIIWMQVLELPNTSVAIQVRIMVISCGQEPATMLSLNMISTAKSQLSETSGMPVFEGRLLSSH